ncbi:hypothetical protein WJX84_003634 [Apatococcus fuscideae]|uniref:Plastid lipid-associated protein/fibrillin conserved domain-containing protein n=1 Tax=Apatococcus fuscideae TaxID=2026836 RepID=A0AAW1SD34_9CHLO
MQALACQALAPPRPQHMCQSQQHGTGFQLPRSRPRPASSDSRQHARQAAPRTEWKLRAADISTAAPSKAGPSQEDAIELLKIAAKEGGVPTTAVAEAMRVLEKAKVQAADWKTTLGGAASPGRSWKLIFTSGEKRVKDAAKGLAKGGGVYVPINAVQRWDASKNEIENGIYLGHVAALTFRGPFDMDGKRLAFDFNKLRVKVGPLSKEFTLKPGDFGTKKEDARKGDGPFFLFAYADDDICVARGRGGGLAMWARTPPTWNLQAGIV